MEMFNRIKGLYNRSGDEDPNRAAFCLIPGITGGGGFHAFLATSDDRRLVT
jgi:hypothetical protein